MSLTRYTHCAIIYCRQASIAAKTLAAHERHYDFITFLGIPWKSGRLVLFIALIPCVNAFKPYFLSRGEDMGTGTGLGCSNVESLS